MYFHRAVFDFITVFVQAEPIALIYKQQPIKQPNKKKKEQKTKANSSLGQL